MSCKVRNGFCDVGTLDGGHSWLSDTGDETTGIEERRVYMSIASFRVN